MLDRPILEPLFFAPFVSSVMRVEPAWIDYNGHLNMAYYNVLFDRAVDEVFELLGCGLAYVKERRRSCYTAEAHVRYLRELRAEDPVRVTFQLLDYDSACISSSSCFTPKRAGYPPPPRTCRCTWTWTRGAPRRSPMPLKRRWRT
jgi:hypothetical protein